MSKKKSNPQLLLKKKKKAHSNATVYDFFLSFLISTILLKCAISSFISTNNEDVCLPAAR